MSELRSVYAEPLPVRPYDPETVDLAAKIARHLRKKGWKKHRITNKWIDKLDFSEHTFLGATKIQMNRERSVNKGKEEHGYEKDTQTTECQAES